MNLTASTRSMISLNGKNFTTSLTSSDDTVTLSPEFDITISAKNPCFLGYNYYEKDSSISIYYSNVVMLCSSGNIIPSFYQPKYNLTVFQTVVKCSAVTLTSTIYESLLDQQRKGNVVLGVYMDIPMKADDNGSHERPVSVVKAHCDIAVDKLVADSKILSKECSLTKKFWG
ncbi:NDR1/HIN1-like protein 13 [Papaver somniferum]|uniref:NDR1/HIN1-like protein 13 n=1 Tax=Papaver somniferum TaxID=3469 RepID=UPI000E6FB8C7|nr:NDR1/HIN1-like protein 13 [Papaver somniferum]